MRNEIGIHACDAFELVSELVNNGQAVKLFVSGDSMFPFLRDKTDSVELSKTSFDKIKIGDIVLIRRDSGVYVMHRVLKKSGHTFTIVGDAQQWTEGPLTESHLVAEVRRFWRGSTPFECGAFWLRTLVVLWRWLLPLRYKIIRIIRTFEKGKSVEVRE